MYAREDQDLLIAFVAAGFEERRPSEGEEAFVWRENAEDENAAKNAWQQSRSRVTSSWSFLSRDWPKTVQMTKNMQKKDPKSARDRLSTANWQIVL